MTASDAAKSAEREAWCLAGTLVVSGVLAGLLAVGAEADALGGGFGRAQILLSAAGGIALLIGLALATPRGRRGTARRIEKGAARPSDALVVAIWIALLAGLTEAGILHLQRTVEHRFFDVSQHAAWMAPVAYLWVMTILLGGFLFVGRFIWPKASRPGVVAMGLGFVALWGVLHLYHPEIHEAAIFVLASGVAVGLSRLVRARFDDGGHGIRRGTLVLVFGVAVVGALHPVGRLLAERRAHAALPAAAADRPNILLIILDTVRAESMSLYGYARRTTPGMERRAAEGIVFDRALATAPWTLPSHGSLFTGRYPEELAADWLTPMGETHPTLAEVLGQHGYMTGGFVANERYTAHHTGLQRGFQRYDSDEITVGRLLSSSILIRILKAPQLLRRPIHNYSELARKDADVVSREFLGWLDGVDDRPFFAFMNYFDAHEPYWAPTWAVERLAAYPIETWPLVPEGDPGITKAKVRFWIEGYDAAILHLDRTVDTLLSDLEARGILENTLVIVTSDHGEQMGRRGFIRHGKSLYMSELHVPLYVRYPERIPGGVRIAEPVSLRDMPATILELVGAAPSLPGRTLTSLWSGSGEGGGDAEEPPPPSGAGDRPPVLAQTSGKPWYPPYDPASRGHMHGLVAGPLHYIRNGDGSEELYDFVADASEEQDLVDSPQQAAALERFRAWVAPHIDRYARRAAVSGDAFEAR